MPNQLTVIGASARAAAFSTLRTGRRPFAIDLFGDVDLTLACPCVRVVDYPDGLLAACQSAPAGPWIYTGALENYPRLVGQIAALRPLLGNGPEVLSRVRDSRLLGSALRESGLNFPDSVATADAIPRDGSWLRKSPRSGGGLQVAAWDENTPPATDSVYYQRRVEGLPCSAAYVAARGQAVLLGATRQLIGLDWTGAGEFHYAGSLGPLPLENSERTALSAIGNCLAERFALVGLFGVDFIRNADGLWPLEVNPRYTASVEVLECALGLQAIELHLQACQSCELPRRDVPVAAGSDDASIAGKVVVYAKQRFAVDESLVEGWLRTNHGRIWPRFADLPQAGSVVEAGAPILTILGAGETADAVLADLRQAATGL